MASETSSDIKMHSPENKETNTLPIKKETTETDLYLQLVSNPSKVLVESPKSSSSLHYNNDDDKTSEASEDNNSSSPVNKKYSESNTRKSKKNSKDSSESSSKAKYEKVNIPRPDNHKNTKNDDSSENVRHSTKEKHHTTPDSNVPVEKPPPVLTPQQLRMKRIELLRKLSDIKSKGYKLSKEYDFNSSIEEMEYEYDLLKSFAERRNGIKLYKNTILNFSNILEFFNNKYDPFGIKLDGWSEHMNVEIDSYDDVMEELYAKYRSTGKSMPPEMKLFMLIAASASAFHFSKAYLTKMPGLDGIMNVQPEIMSKLVNGKKQQNKFMSEQELNIETQKREMQEREKQMKQQMRNSHVEQQQQYQQQQYQQQQYQQQQYQQQQQQQQYQQPQPQQQYQPPPPPAQKMKQPENFQNFHKSVNFNTSVPLGTPNQTIQSNDPRSILQTNKVIKSSDSVKDILSRLHSRETDTVETQDETSSVNNDRLISDTLSDSSNGSKKNKKTKKNIMSVM